MKALTVVPGTASSTKLDDVAEPPESDGPVLVETLATGVCGTDQEIVSGAYGWAPPGRERLVLGHESIGRVTEAPAGSGFAEGDMVVGIVRRPDPVPCLNCSVGEWDFCRNGRYTERGIKEHDGYCSERYRITPDFLVKVDPSLGLMGVLLEPASVVAKAWEQVERIGSRARWEPSRALVTGAGPIGLLAALMGVQRGLEVHVLDRVTGGPKPGLVSGIGATYHHDGFESIGGDIDVVIECTGAGPLVFDAMEKVAAGAVVCLTGVSSGGRSLQVDAGLLNRQMVLANEAVVGSVNANRSHYEAGAEALAKAERSWLETVVSRRVPLQSWQEAFRHQDDDVKVVLRLAS
ncbi:MAG: glucose 1-dehydrogenase [Acidimicrobiales bacterium]